MVKEIWRTCKRCIFAKNVSVGLDGDVFAYCSEKARYVNGGIFEKECPMFMINPALKEGVVVNVNGSTNNSDMLDPDLLSRLRDKSLL